MEGILDTLIKYEKLLEFTGWLIALLIAIYTANRIRLTSQKNRFDYYKAIRSEYVNKKLLDERNRVMEFWVRNKLKPPRESNRESLSLASLGKKRDNDSQRKFIEQELGIIIECDVTATFVRENKEIVDLTESVLNEYEDLGKLVKANILSKKDVKILFDTMIGDTFIACFPYIIFRRKSKPTYAKNMQALITLVPNVSANLNKSW